MIVSVFFDEPVIKRRIYPKQPVQGQYAMEPLIVPGILYN